VRDFQGACGAVFSTVSFGLVGTQQVRSPTHGQAAIEMLAYRHGAAGQRVAKTCFIQLQIAVLQQDRVVLRNRSLCLDREHPIQIFTRALAECRPFLSRWLGELAVELRHISLA